MFETIVGESVLDDSQLNQLRRATMAKAKAKKRE